MARIGSSILDMNGRFPAAIDSIGITAFEQQSGAVKLPKNQVRR
jgi:hypothetical protein